MITLSYLTLYIVKILNHQRIDSKKKKIRCSGRRLHLKYGTLHSAQTINASLCCNLLRQEITLGHLIRIKSPFDVILSCFLLMDTKRWAILSIAMDIFHIALKESSIRHETLRHQTFGKNLSLLYEKKVGNYRKKTIFFLQNICCKNSILNFSLSKRH